jgi:heme/copper-type cytochrome/quinol oxidase subunit 1
MNDRLSLPQRIVLIIAFGLVLGVGGLYLVSLGSAPGTGWYAYAPLAHTVALPGLGLPGWLRLIIWLGLIGLWALGSVWLLRPPPE